MANGNSSVAPLLERVFMFLEDGDFKSADEYCEKVLDLDPKNAQAYLGKLMAGLSAKTKEEIPQRDFPIEKRVNYQKAIRFGDQALVEELTRYNDILRKKAHDAECRSIYDEAKKLAKELTAQSQLRASDEFMKIAEYHDSKDRANACRIKAKEIAYDVADKLAKELTSQSQLRASDEFMKITGYRDSDVRAKECIAKSKELDVIERKDTIYYKALDDMKKDDISRIEDAIRKFKTIIEWKDSENKIAECNKKIANIKDQQEQKRIAAVKAAKEKKNKIIITISSILIIVLALIIILSVVGASMRNNMRETLSGKTVSGTYSYYCKYFDTRDTYIIYFVDENYCNITVHYTTDNTSGKDYNERKEFKNVPYEITGGVFGLKFNWDKDIGPYHSVEPFEIDVSGGSIRMYTPNFNSGTSMIMSKK
ncbi:MAG: hypothetical protein J6S71_02380 [Clostridia bacterium]|nr:hypothetical protein [Clostridia bacterium]